MELENTKSNWMATTGVLDSVPHSRKTYRTE